MKLSLESESEREELLRILTDTTRSVKEQVDDYDPETLEEERLQIKWIRTLGYLAGQHRKLKKDTDIDQIQDELDLLENATSLNKNV